MERAAPLPAICGFAPNGRGEPGRNQQAQIIAMPTGMNALPVLNQTDRVLPCRCQLDTFLLYPHGHEMPFAYERPLCAMSGRSVIPFCSTTRVGVQTLRSD
jgi:hypothetical protein